MPPRSPNPLYQLMYQPQGGGGLWRALQGTAVHRAKIRPREEADNTPRFPRDSGERRKAGEGTRTLDIQLGKLALYQLSYARDFGECSTRDNRCAADRARAA